jgi:hypothetical protein
MNDSEQRELRDAELTARANAQLEAEIDSLNAPTLSRLNQARQTALKEMDSRSPFILSPFILGGVNWVSVSVVLVVLVGFWTLDPGMLMQPVTEQPLVMQKVEQKVQQQEATGQPLQVEADLEMLLAFESLELLENLEFYSWLETDLMLITTS